MEDESPGFVGRTKSQVRSLGRTINNSSAKRVLVYGLRTAIVNTTAVLVTDALNFYLESRGMNSRRITVTSVPNPDRPADRSKTWYGQKRSA